MKVGPCRWVVLAAAGAGRRFDDPLPKQFHTIEGRPLVVWALLPFFAANSKLRIVVVVAEGQREKWEAIRSEHLGGRDIQTCIGGAARSDSVLNGLEMVPDGCLVAIHDAARPAISPHFVNRLFDAAEVLGNAIPYLPVHDSVRRLHGDDSTVVDRDNLVLVQTPQVFYSHEIRKALQAARGRGFTDEASAHQWAGNQIHLVKGLPSNTKVTYREDMGPRKADPLATDLGLPPSGLQSAFSGPKLSTHLR